MPYYCMVLRKRYRGKQTPGPSDYGRVGSTLKLSGGVLSQFTPMSDVDWRIKRARDIPGPGEYEPRDVSSTAGATFGEFQASGVPAAAAAASKQRQWRQ